jgi:hypothetical protein
MASRGKNSATKEFIDALLVEELKHRNSDNGTLSAIYKTTEFR